MHRKHRKTIPGYSISDSIQEKTKHFKFSPIVNKYKCADWSKKCDPEEKGRNLETHTLVLEKTTFTHADKLEYYGNWTYDVCTSLPLIYGLIFSESFFKL